MAEGDFQRGLDALRQQVAALTVKMSSLQASLDGFRITGPGFSGTGPTGILFDPAAANANEGGIDLTMTVCVNDGAGGFTQGTVFFQNGRLKMRS